MEIITAHHYIKKFSNLYLNKKYIDYKIKIKKNSTTNFEIYNVLPIKIICPGVKARAYIYKSAMNLCSFPDLDIKDIRLRFLKIINKRAWNSYPIISINDIPIIRISDIKKSFSFFYYSRKQMFFISDYVYWFFKYCCAIGTSYETKYEWSKHYSTWNSVKDALLNNDFKMHSYHWVPKEYGEIKLLIRRIEAFLHVNSWGHRLTYKLETLEEMKKNKGK